MTEPRLYRVIHDPHGDYVRGMLVSVPEIRKLLESHEANGLELSDGEKNYRLYQGGFYFLDANNWMWNLRIPKRG